MDRPSRIAVSATEVNRGRQDPAGWRLDTRSDPPGIHASQIQRPAGTAAEKPETEADRAKAIREAERASAVREASRAVFREAATVAETSLPGARGRRHPVQTTNVAVPQGFKYLQLANEAIEYVQNISKAATSRPSHLYSHIVRDSIGRLITQNPAGDYSILKPGAARKMAMLRKFRDDTGRDAVRQIRDEMAKGVQLTESEQYAILFRRSNATLLNMAKSMGADDLVANCSEKSMLAFDMLANKDDNPQLDVVELAETAAVTADAAITGVPTHLARGPDHVLLLIGRDPNSDITDPGTWGDDTVICDPWAKRAYAVSAFKEEMELLSSTTNGQTQCKAHISWPANTPYNSDPTVIYRDADGIKAPSPGGPDHQQNSLNWI